MIVERSCWLIAKQQFWILATARAIETRCCSPPDNCAGKLFMRCPSPTAFKGFLLHLERLLRFQPPVPHFPSPLSSVLDYKIGRRNRHRLFYNKWVVFHQKRKCPRRRQTHAHRRSCPCLLKYSGPSISCTAGPKIMTNSPFSISKFTSLFAIISVSPTW